MDVATNPDVLLLNILAIECCAVEPSSRFPSPGLDNQEKVTIACLSVCLSVCLSLPSCLRNGLHSVKRKNHNVPASVTNDEGVNVFVGLCYASQYSGKRERGP
jgi:hypothetical protein